MKIRNAVQTCMRSFFQDKRQGKCLKLCYAKVMFASSTSWFSRINPFIPNALFLYPLKTPENRKGVENWCIGNEWVKRVWVSRSNDNVPREWTSLGELYSRALQIIYRTNDVKRFFWGSFSFSRKQGLTSRTSKI